MLYRWPQNYLRRGLRPVRSWQVQCQQAGSAVRVEPSFVERQIIMREFWYQTVQ